MRFLTIYCKKDKQNQSFCKGDYRIRRIWVMDRHKVDQNSFSWIFNSKLNSKDSLFMTQTGKRRKKRFQWIWTISVPNRLESIKSRKNPNLNVAYVAKHALVRLSRVLRHSFEAELSTFTLKNARNILVLLHCFVSPLFLLFLSVFMFMNRTT